MKPGTSRTAPAFEVRTDPEDLLGMDLEIGPSVNFLVQEQVERDTIGRTRATTWVFLRHASQQAMLDEA